VFECSSIYKLQERVSVCVFVSLSVTVSNLTGVLLQARVSAVSSLTLFGLEMQKILLHISVKEGLRRLWLKNKHSDKHRQLNIKSECLFF